jgi:hypothetical protein
MAALNDKFVISIEPSIVGCKLSLTILENKTYSSWAVKDAFNGLTREVPVGSQVEGFFKENSVVDLYIFDNTHQCNIIKNIKIIKKTEVTLDV